jgi:hypothetical protein
MASGLLDTIADQESKVSSRNSDGLDVAFIEVAVKQGHIDAAIGKRLLAFARLKRRPVAKVAGDLGLLSATCVERTVRLARYRVARAEDRLLAAAAVGLRILTDADAHGALARQRDLYRAGKGFVRFLALLRSEGRISVDVEGRIRAEALRAAARGTSASRRAERGESKPTPAPRRTGLEPAKPEESGSTYRRLRAAFA